MTLHSRSSLLLTSYRNHQYFLLCHISTVDLRYASQFHVNTYIVLLPPPETHLARAPSGSARLMCACGPSSESRWADTSCCLSCAACWASTTGVRRSSALLSFAAAWTQRDPKNIYMTVNWQKFCPFRLCVNLRSPKTFQTSTLL